MIVIRHDIKQIHTGEKILLPMSIQVIGLLMNHLGLKIFIFQYFLYEE